MKTIQKDISTYRALVDQFLDDKALIGFPQNLSDAAQHIMNQKGKRLRPIVLLMIAEGYGVMNNRAISPAVAVETFHNFTLVHDDIMDKADLRRGKNTVHKEFSVAKAIVAGDAMFPHAISLLIKGNEDKTLSLIRSFLKMSQEVMEGQQLDMDFETREKVTIDEYLNMIRLKTSVLFGCSCEIGAILGDAPEKDRQKLYNFGVYAGIAFQIMDDYLDTFGDHSFGKKIGGDIVLNKKTFLLIKAIQKANPMQRTVISALLEKEDEAIKIKEFQSIFKEIGVDKMALDTMDKFHQQSISEINATSLPLENKRRLIDFAELMLNRTK